MRAADGVPDAINRFGLDLLRAQSAPGGEENALLSPYSIVTALAMTSAGADGATRDEMQRVLHLPADEEATWRGLSALATALTELQAASQRRVEAMRHEGAAGDPIELNVANRLFAEARFAFRPAFVATLRERFGAPLEEMDFGQRAEEARQHINAWVAGETRARIQNLIPDGAITGDTRAVLANALYLKAPWEHPFEPRRTEAQPFWVAGQTRVDVPTMRQREHFGFAQREGATLLALPYEGGDLQLLVLLPDKRDGLAGLEARVTPALLAGAARLPRRDVVLHLPKFELEPPGMPLGKQLQGLGMKTAFDQPPGSANFDRMAPRRPDEYLYISEVFHKTWLSLDEVGTEAAAATAVVMAFATSAPGPRPEPVEVRVDRPFLFAIQHVRSGACLFLGRVTDPR